MDLFVIRHSLAASGAGRSDFDRPLTAAGAARAVEIAAGLEALGVSFDLLLHSPLVRAAETARYLAPRAAEVRAFGALADGGIEEIVSGVAGARVALVGHLPTVGALVAWLLTGDGRHGSRLVFEPGTVAWLVGSPEAGGMGLKALFPPSAFEGRA